MISRGFSVQAVVGCMRPLPAGDGTMTHKPPYAEMKSIQGDYISYEELIASGSAKWVRVGSFQGSAVFQRFLADWEPLLGLKSSDAAC
jgi:hypothetical protein